MAGVLLVAAGATFYAIYNEGNIAANNAENLLYAYEQNIASDVQNEFEDILAVQATSMPDFGKAQ